MRPVPLGPGYASQFKKDRKRYQNNLQPMGELREVMEKISKREAVEQQDRSLVETTRTVASALSARSLPRRWMVVAKAGCDSA